MQTKICNNKALNTMGETGAEEVVDMREGWADPDLVSGLV